MNALKFLSPWVIQCQRRWPAAALTQPMVRFYPHGSFNVKDKVIFLMMVLASFYPHGSFNVKDDLLNAECMLRLEQFLSPWVIQCQRHKKTK